MNNYIYALRMLGAEPELAGQGNLRRYDGLLLPGGADINPWRYGQKNVGSRGISDERDALQFAALEHFVKMERPVLGICRGQQVINVYFGGTLIQHLCGSLHAGEDEAGRDPVHRNTSSADSFTARLYGTEFYTNSAHHQAIDRLGSGLRAVMWSEDGVIEAVVHETLPVYGVQWHPERMCFRHSREDTVDGSRIMRFFLDRCAETMAKI